MTEDEPPTREEALDASETLDGLIHDAHQGVDNASDSARESREAVGDIEAAFEEIRRQSETAQSALQRVNPSETFDELGEPWEILDSEANRFLKDIAEHLESAEDSEDGFYDTVMIDGTEYEVLFSEIGSEDDEDDEDADWIDEDTKRSVCEAWREGAQKEDIADAHGISDEETMMIVRDRVQDETDDESGSDEESGFPTGKN